MIENLGDEYPLREVCNGKVDTRKNSFMPCNDHSLSKTEPNITPSSALANVMCTGNSLRGLSEYRIFK